MAIEWLELTIKQHGDTFEAYEALTDERIEGTWDEIREWIEEGLLPLTEEAIFEKGGKK